MSAIFFAKPDRHYWQKYASHYEQPLSKAESKDKITRK